MEKENALLVWSSVYGVAFYNLRFIYTTIRLIPTFITSVISTHHHRHPLKSVSLYMAHKLRVPSKTAQESKINKTMIY